MLMKRMIVLWQLLKLNHLILSTLFITINKCTLNLIFIVFCFIQRSGSYFLYLEAYASWMLIQELG